MIPNLDRTIRLFALVAASLPAFALHAPAARAGENEPAPAEAPAAPAPAIDPVAVATPGSSEGAPPTIENVADLRIAPEAVALKTDRDHERFVLTAVLADGLTKDVTHKAELRLEPEGIVRIDERFQLIPVADGTATLTASYAGRQITLPITVADASVYRPMSFKLDMEPVLMKAGCNSGGCHGAASGKNGFRLSLFGFDAHMDYLNMTRQTKARRLTTADPETSLILQKATSGVAHEGGERFKPGSPLYTMMEKWIAEGALEDPEGLPRIDGVDIYPKQLVMQGQGAGDKAGIPGETHRVIVRARYSDGTDRDVTSLAVLASLNDTSATIDDEGVVTAKERGEAAIIARFGTFAVVTKAIVIPPNEEFAWPEEIAPVNYIDEMIHDKLRKMRMLPSDVCDDATFVRRVHLDIVGVPPTVAEAKAFVDDPAPTAEKRAKLVDALLLRPEFPEVWAMKWAEMLRIESSSRRISFKAMYRYTNWLRDQIVADVPVNELARKLLTADGGNFANPASNFYLVETDPLLVAENVAQVFTGIRVQCAQCHNHPFERWTMDDYYSFSAFFAQIGRKQAEDPRETVVFNSGGGEVGHLNGGRAMPPKFLGSPDPVDLQGRDRRAVLAEWLTAPDNEWFSKVFANRVWEHFMGRGIVDPPDDVRVSNPPSNPELFDRLGQEFVKSGYDMRGLVRTICNSRTYQLSTRTNPTNETDTSNFAHAMPRRMPAEQLLDAICQVTETPQKFGGLPLGARAAQVADGGTGNYFLDIFGRPTRQSACSCERRNEPTLSQALHLINGDTVQARVQAGSGLLARLLAAETPHEEITREIYLAAYSRPPNEEEMKRATDHLAGYEDKKQGLEDLFWAVLNSAEFVFQH